jgi:hypothetical protein
MNRQNLPCANVKINGCTGLVNQKGNILCETCTETRKIAIHNKREFDFDALMIKYKELDSELSKYKLDLENSEICTCTLNEKINNLLEDKKRTELNSSQLALDNEKLSIDNQQLKILNESLKAQNDLLTKQISNSTESKNSAPQTARTRGQTVFSKIPGLKTITKK